MDDGWFDDSADHLAEKARITTSTFDFEYLAMSGWLSVVRALLNNPKIPTYVLAYIVLFAVDSSLITQASSLLRSRAIADEVVEASILPVDWIANLYVDDEMTERVKNSSEMAAL